MHKDDDDDEENIQRGDLIQAARKQHQPSSFFISKVIIPKNVNHCFKVKRTGFPLDGKGSGLYPGKYTIQSPEDWIKKSHNIHFSPSPERH